jgi:hypothetical protein
MINDHRLLAVIAVYYIIARDTSRLTVIRTNLKDIESAMAMGFENQKHAGDPRMTFRC